MGFGGTEYELDLTRMEAADRLAAFAEQLRSGVVQIESEKVTIPERVKLKVEAEDGELEFEIIWGEALDATDDEDEEEIVYGGSEDDDDEDEDDSPYGDLDDDGSGSLGGPV